MDGHLSDERLTELIEQRIDPQGLAEVHRHIEQCASCRRLVVEVAGSYLADPTPRASGSRSGTLSDTLSNTSSGADLHASEPAGSSRIPPGGRSVPQEFEEFKILRPLGQGAMGQVYLARDSQLDRLVAIKFIVDSGADPGAHQRFVSEARAIARLTHPNVVAVYRRGQVGGRPFLVSEFVEGTSLDKLERPVPWQRVLEIGMALARGLQAAHQAGVLHRDIKPANAILANDGEVKLLDFGLAKLSDSLAEGSASSSAIGGGPDGQQSATLTHGSLVGTPLYLAPECWRGQPATVRSDLYSLGAVLYELCAGRVPHPAQSLRELQERVQQEEVVPLRKIDPKIDPSFSAVVSQCLLRDPAQRYQGAKELYQALAGLSGKAARRRLLVRAGVAAATLGAAVLTYPWLQRRTVSPEVYINGAQFLMGSSPNQAQAAYQECREKDLLPKGCKAEIFLQYEQPIHAVRVPSFWIDRTEVTNVRFAKWINSLPGLRFERTPYPAADPKHREYRIYLDDKLLLQVNPEPAVLDGRIPQGLDVSHSGDALKPGVAADAKLVVLSEWSRKPVRMVTWYGARRFCQDHGQRLPTEAEWELAAAGEEHRRYPWGSESPSCVGVVFARLEQREDHWIQECVLHPVKLADVGASIQDVTPQGVHDLAGNVAEWTEDLFRLYDLAPTMSSDLKGEDPGHAFRGGSFAAVAPLLRPQVRGHESNIHQDVGFRCARSAAW